jgi:oligoendopeptidase F
MDYKGFNIAIHELGHTVEQVFSMSRIDHTLLQGVPNTGFTEAFAFLFQARDIDLLGVSLGGADDREALEALDRFWSTYEIAGIGLLDIEIWHWMYDHPEASPQEAREAMINLARELWNRYYAPVFGMRDVVLPAIYSHIIAYGLYTPDYSLGMIITSQVEDFVRSRSLADEMERMCLLGRIAPDVWMEEAVGEPVSSEALLEAAEAALSQLAATSATGG